VRLPIPIPLGRGPDAIGPTAHYTGHVWGRHGLSHDRLSTREGRVLYDVLAPAMVLSRALGGPTIEGLLISRHLIIDDLLARAIDDGRVSQVIEIACGMSPRGWRFAERYGDQITYIEADLPKMAERKRDALEEMGSLGERHRVVDLDALQDDGHGSLAAVASELDRTQGLAIVTEGLLSYFGEDDVRGMWRRFARELRRFGAGLYLADLILGGSLFPDGAFQAALSSFVGRRVHRHFDDEASAIQDLRAAGFADARLHRADRHPAAGEAGHDPAAERVHVLEATT